MEGRKKKGKKISWFFFFFDFLINLNKGEKIRFWAEKSWKFWKNGKFQKGWILNHCSAWIRTCLYTIASTAMVHWTFPPAHTLSERKIYQPSSYRHRAEQQFLGAFHILLLDSRCKNILHWGEEEEFSTEAGLRCLPSQTPSHHSWQGITNHTLAKTESADSQEFNEDWLTYIE